VPALRAVLCLAQETTRETGALLSYARDGVEKMLSWAAQDGEKMSIWGSGDGRIVIMAAEVGADSTGVEFDRASGSRGTEPDQEPRIGEKGASFWETSCSRTTAPPTC